MKKLEVSSQDIIYNLNQIRKMISSENKNTDIIAVVKANGMGLDLVQYSKLLVKNGIRTLAVANLDEALNLRNAKIDAHIMMLSPTSIKSEVKELIKNDIIITIGCMKDLDVAEEICIGEDKEINASLKIDTGFSRYGFLCDDMSIITVLKNAQNVKITNVFTHLSKAIDDNSSWLQYEDFVEVKRKIEKEGFDNLRYHICNSTGFLKYPEMWMDAVRLGSCIQGRVLLKKEMFKVIGNFKTNIAEIKTIIKGTPVSYGNTFIAPKEMTIAVIPVRIYGWLQLRTQER